MNHIEDESLIAGSADYDINGLRQELCAGLYGANQVEEAVGQIQVYSTGSILSFGTSAAKQLSHASDGILKEISSRPKEDDSELFSSMARLMQGFDLADFQEKKGFLSRFFSSPHTVEEKNSKKYHALGEDLERMYIRMKQYEGRLKRENHFFENLFQSQLSYYRELMRYILAGEQGCKEIEELLIQKQSEYEKSKNAELEFDIISLKQALQLLERRVHDLRLSENIAMQTLPMLKLLEYNNAALAQKINAAFVVTIPIFKQAMERLLQKKRQRLQQEAMAILQEKQKALAAKKQAEQATHRQGAEQQKDSAEENDLQMLGEASAIISSGITEGKRLKEAADRSREENAGKLQRIQEEFSKGRS